MAGMNPIRIELVEREKTSKCFTEQSRKNWLLCRSYVPRKSYYP